MYNINKSSAYKRGYDDYYNGKSFSNPYEYYEYYDDYYDGDEIKDYEKGYRDAEYDDWEDD